MKIGLVGATGLVGTEMLRLLEERAFPVSELRVYASTRSEGRKLPFAGGDVTCEILHDGCFDGLDLVVIDVDDPLALEWAPQAVAAGAKVVDNSAAFRMDADVPLVVAEVNPDDVHDAPRGIVACPNCTTMVLVTALAPLHRAVGIKRMVVATYQAVSGAGYPGVPSLDILGNVIPYIGEEEGKIERELPKMLGRLTSDGIEHAALVVSAHANRVAVEHGHTVCLSVELEAPVSPAEAVRAMRDWTGAAGVAELPSAPHPPLLVTDALDRPQPRRDVMSGGGMQVDVK